LPIKIRIVNPSNIEIIYYTIKIMCDVMIFILIVILLLIVIFFWFFSCTVCYNIQVMVLIIFFDEPFCCMFNLSRALPSVSNVPRTLTSKENLVCARKVNLFNIAMALQGLKYLNHIDSDCKWWYFVQIENLLLLQCKLMKNYIISETFFTK